MMKAIFSGVHMRRRDDEVALVLAVVVVGDDDDLAARECLDGVSATGVEHVILLMKGRLAAENDWGDGALGLARRSARPFPRDIQACRCCKSG